MGFCLLLLKKTSLVVLVLIFHSAVLHVQVLALFWFTAQVCLPSFGLAVYCSVCTPCAIFIPQFCHFVCFFWFLHCWFAFLCRSYSYLVLCLLLPPHLLFLVAFFCAVVQDTAFDAVRPACPVSARLRACAATAVPFTAGSLVLKLNGRTTLLLHMVLVLASSRRYAFACRVAQNARTNPKRTWFAHFLPLSPPAVFAMVVIGSFLHCCVLSAVLGSKKAGSLVKRMLPATLPLYRKPDNVAPVRFAFCVLDFDFRSFFISILLFVWILWFGFAFLHFAPPPPPLPVYYLCLPP